MIFKSLALAACICIGHLSSAFADAAAVAKVTRFNDCGEVKVVKINSKLRLHFWIKPDAAKPHTGLMNLVPNRPDGSYATEAVEAFKSLELNSFGRVCLEGFVYPNGQGQWNLVPIYRRSNYGR